MALMIEWNDGPIMNTKLNTKIARYNTRWLPCSNMISDSSPPTSVSADRPQRKLSRLVLSK